MVQILQVASSSQPSAVAGAIAGVIRERKVCELQAIGAGAINQTVKAIAIARGYMAPAGVDLICTPAFSDIQINGEERTAIRFKVEIREGRA
ncbi:MAG: stage V sporulation protein S [Candidatus Melainabacteria bacterium HGW-Melainabacteria-1]|nr:MAG: stage V sporulation protein S [Candidatus Melainabacteria bacterium HGW-Melainabacteria-1]